MHTRWGQILLPSTSLRHLTGKTYLLFLPKVIINGTLEEVSQEELMGIVQDLLYLEIAKRRQEKTKAIMVDDLATELQNHLRLTNNKCKQLHVNEGSLEPASRTAKKFPGLKNLSQARALISKERSSPSGYQFLGNNGTVEVTITGPLEVTKPQCERLLMKGLGRTKHPVTQDESTGKIVLEEL